MPCPFDCSCESRLDWLSAVHLARAGHRGRSKRLGAERPRRASSWRRSPAARPGCSAGYAACLSLRRKSRRRECRRRPAGRCSRTANARARPCRFDDLRLAAELADPDHQRLVQQPALVEIGRAAPRAPVGRRNQVVLEPVEVVAVRVPEVPAVVVPVDLPAARRARPAAAPAARTGRGCCGRTVAPRPVSATDRTPSALGEASRPNARCLHAPTSRRRPSARRPARCASSVLAAARGGSRQPSATAPSSSAARARASPVCSDRR